VIDKVQIDLSAYNGEPIVTNDLGPVCGRNLARITATARALQNEARGKSPEAQRTALNAIMCLKAIARGRGGPATYASLEEKMEMLGVSAE
jgi:hypothetical protein